MKNKGEDGFALIAVLGLMLMLSIIALGILKYAAVGARAASSERRVAVDKYLVVAALTQFEHEVMADARARTKVGGEHSMKVLGRSVTLSVESENARLNINRASSDEIIKYLIAQKLDKNDAERVAAKILDWRDADNLKQPGGGEAIDYGGHDVRPRNSPFESAGEMKDLKDIEGLLESFDGFTVYSHSSGGQKISGRDFMGRSLGVGRIKVQNGEHQVELVARLLPTSNHSIRVLKIN